MGVARHRWRRAFWFPPHKGVEEQIINIEKIIEGLSKIRPVFHSEADFQHALAWEIQKHYPEAKIRLEIHPERLGKREYLDIWIKSDNQIVAIELKYKARKATLENQDEKFFLLNHVAYDCGRYDFIKDVVRLEGYIEKHSDAVGYAIMLTNEKNYWKESKKKYANDEQFKIYEGRKLNGRLNWKKGTAEGTKKGREAPLIVKNSYNLHWLNYSELQTEEFKYLLVKIK
jgi:hypothetical protein